MGLLLGVIQMTLDFACTQPQCGQQDTCPRVVKDIRYLSFTLILPRVTLAACVP